MDELYVRALVCEGLQVVGRRKVAKRWMVAVCDWCVKDYRCLIDVARNVRSTPSKADYRELIDVKKRKSGWPLYESAGVHTRAHKKGAGVTDFSSLP